VVTVRRRVTGCDYDELDEARRAMDYAAYALTAKRSPAVHAGHDTGAGVPPVPLSLAARSIPMPA
jgi:hypothetical protein